VLGPQRRFLACLTALAVVVATVQGVTGIGELALFLTPAFLLGALLLSGRYVAEDRIVARWRAAVPRRRPRRRAARRRPPAGHPLRTQLLQGSFGVRGPPALGAPAD
jgi:hypothetical protein